MEKCVARTVARLIIGGALTSMAAVAHSAIVYDSRVQTRTVSFSDLTFSDASVFQQNVLTGSGALGDSSVYTDSQATGTTGLAVASSGGFSASLVSPYSNGSGQFGVNVVGPATTGTVSFSSFVAAVDPSLGFAVSSAVKSTSGGLYTLELHASAYGYVQPGGTDTINVVLPGNWSNSGTATGDADLLGINSLFTVMKNFVYNSQTNTTTFQAVDANYDGTSKANIDIMLYGSAAPVPLPAAAWLMLSGLGGLGAFARKTRQAKYT